MASIGNSRSTTRGTNSSGSTQEARLDDALVCKTLGLGKVVVQTVHAVQTMTKSNKLSWYFKHFVVDTTNRISVTVQHPTEVTFALLHLSQLFQVDTFPIARNQILIYTVSWTRRRKASLNRITGTSRWITYRFVSELFAQSYQSPAKPIVCRNHYGIFLE